MSLALAILYRRCWSNSPTHRKTPHHGSWSIRFKVIQNSSVKSTRPAAELDAVSAHHPVICQGEIWYVIGDAEESGHHQRHPIRLAALSKKT
ncbi:MAG: hypothetical protein U0Y68_23605 [Blastocatellia bacterium]